MLSSNALSLTSLLFVSLAVICQNGDKYASKLLLSNPNQQLLLPKIIQEGPNFHRGSGRLLAAEELNYADRWIDGELETWRDIQANRCKRILSSTQPLAPSPEHSTTRRCRDGSGRRQFEQNIKLLPA